MRLLSSFLAASILLMSPGLAGYAAAAQVVSSRATGAVGAGVQGSLPVMTGASFSHAGISLMPASLITPSLTTPALTVGRTLAGPMVQAAAPVAGQVAVAAPILLAPAAPGQAAAVQAEAVPTALGVLRQGAPAEKSRSEPVEASAARMGRAMDGSLLAKWSDEVPVLAGGLMSRAAPLAKAEISAPQAKPVLRSPSVPSAKSALAKKLVLTAVVAGIALLLPTVVLAAGAPVAAGVTITQVLGYMNPGASIVAAAVGSLYGAFAAKGKDGKGASTGDLFGSILRYGVLAGAGVYASTDIAAMLFGATRAVISPLPTALATAALGQGAFQGKFADEGTSPADRIMAVFPAIAAALGLSIVEKAVPGVGLLMGYALNAMTVTGVASALFAVTYDPAKSPKDGPSRMARGYVLQALMSGLALAVGNPYLAALFAALAVWGFVDVMRGAGGTIGQFLKDLYQKVFPPAPKAPKKS
jgi:hypothetical protein